MSATNLTSSERAHLRAKANTLNAVFQLGKGGLGENFINQMDEILEARELVKISLLETCELSVKEAAQQICDACNCQSVQMIGRKIVFYRQAKDKDKRKITLS
jgi:RNA-binding protein